MMISTCAARFPRNWLFSPSVIACLLLIVSSGCTVPTSRTRVIPEGIAGDAEKLVAQIDLLQPGMDVRQVFQLLQVNSKTPGVREIITAEEKQRILYGATQLVGSPNELEQFRQRLNQHRILEIKLVDIERSLTFDSPLSVVSAQMGPSFIGYVIFFDGKLMSPPNVPRSFYQNETTRIYISDLFGALVRTGLSRGMSHVGP